MHRSLAYVAVALLLAGCGGSQTAASSVPGARTLAAASSGRPPAQGRIAYYSRHWGASSAQLRVVNVDGTGAKLLLRRIRSCPSWSPDGTRIATVVDDAIAIVNADGSGVRRLPDNEVGWVQWSPSGRELLIQEIDGIYVRDVSGGPPLRLSASGSSAVWSPDGRSVAFSDDYPNYGLKVVNVTGTGMRSLTTTAASSSLDWAPDGRRLVFDDFVDTDRKLGKDRELFTIGADGRDRQRLTHEWGGDHLPAWSPIGARIAYIHNEDRRGRGLLLTMKPNGGSKVDLSSPRGSNSDPSWSPDGRKLVYVLRQVAPDAKDPRVYVMNADGTSRRPVSPPHDYVSCPVWSPTP